MIFLSRKKETKNVVYSSSDSDEDFIDNESESLDDELFDSLSDTENEEEEEKEETTDDDDLDENESDHEFEVEELKEKIFKLLKKVRNIVSIVRKSGVICCFVVNKIKDLKQTNSNFIKDFHVRWNSTYLMLKRFVDLKKIVIN
jgi:hypothetical protein